MASREFAVARAPNLPAKSDLLDIYGEVWRTGGTKTQTGDQLDDYLEIRAAKVETGGNADSTTISWSCLKGDFDDVFKVFADLLHDPEFRADKLDLAQKESFDAISRRNDDVDENRWSRVHANWPTGRRIPTLATRNTPR